MNGDFEGLENELRATLRREAAPPDFAARVLAKSREQEPAAKVVRLDAARMAGPQTKSAWHRPVGLALAAAIAGLAIVPAAVLDYRRREEAKGRQAKQDLLIALAITRSQLQQARARIQPAR
jgi:hypothetical protein